MKKNYIDIYKLMEHSYDYEKAWKEFVKVCDRDPRQKGSNPEDLLELLDNPEPRLSYLPYYQLLSDEQLEKLLNSRDMTTFYLDDDDKARLRSMIRSELSYRNSERVIKNLKKMSKETNQIY